MAIEGTLEDIRLPEILQRVAHQHKTGILTVQSESTIVALTFLGGSVVAADSLAETVEERLGELLVRQGLLGRGAFAEIASRQEAGEGRLVDLLVSQGSLSREQVLRALRQQTYELLTELLDWRAGEFKFYSGDEVSFEEGIEPIQVDELLLGNGGPVELSAPAPAPVGVSAVAPAGVPAVAPAEPAPVAVAHRPPAFVPAAPRVVVEMPLPEPEVEPEAAAVPRLPSWLAPAVALALALALVAVTLAGPTALLLPFPWQRDDRAAFGEVQRVARQIVLDRAAKTFFLLEGRFPDSLERLTALGLLDRTDLRGEGGRALVLEAREDSYEVRLRGSTEPAQVEAITGNFLLDPAFLRSSEPVPEDPPLVLLD